MSAPSCDPAKTRIAANLSGVSETMLWSLHNRASETKRPDAVLLDPDSVRIHNSIDYDFDAHFGEPCGSLAARAAAIDDVLRGWLARYPDGCIVSLGEGLETQAGRVDNGRMRWCSVDLPAAISLRERFLTPTDRFQHVAASVFDPAWLDAVDASRGVCIVAQGLLMYLEPDFVSRLFSRIAHRFPGADMVFDTVPRWFSDLTLVGLHQTPHYRLPAMPWGIDRNEIEPALRAWRPDVAAVRFLDYRCPRGAPRLLGDMIECLAIARHGVPSLVHVTSLDTDGAPSAARRSVGRSRPIEIDAIGRVSAMAIQNLACGDDIARASGAVIAKRVALGIDAAWRPDRADPTEFARIIPEKVEAFSAAGKVMLQHADEANRQIIEHVSSEVMTAADAVISMSRCADPADLAMIQGRFAYAWMARASSHVTAMGMLAMSAQAGALAPIQRTVVENSQRLAGSGFHRKSATSMSSDSLTLRV
jgi:O-methyltransferase involved in polyketide biosynthesis